MNDRIERALAALPALVDTHDELGVRSLLEGLYDAGADDLIADLATTEDAAAVWGIGTRAAQKHIVRLHERNGVGWRISERGTWLIRRSVLTAHPPAQVGRPKKS